MEPSKLIVTRHGQGDLGARDWGKQGDGLYVSARHLWASFIMDARRFERTDDARQLRKTIARHAIVNAGYPKAAILLIGYCIEMYLKGGLAKLLIGCAEDTFRSTLKAYSHSLEKLAKEIIHDLSKAQLDDLKTLSKFILNDARYPVEANTSTEYVDKTNERSKIIYNGLAFRRYCKLAKHIRCRIAKIDNDSSSMCSTRHWIVDVDGYLCYRYGGGLPPRITYRRCTSSSVELQVTAEEVRGLLAQAGQLLPGPIDEYEIYADSAKDGKRKLKRIHPK